MDAKRDWGFAGDFVEAAFAEVELLLGDPFKAKEKLGREPQVRSGELVGMMVRADLQDQGREAYLKEEGVGIAAVPATDELRLQSW